MIRLIILLIILACAFIFGPTMADHQGYVMFALAGYTIEMSAVTAILLAVVFYFVLLVAEAVLSRLFHFRNRWFGWQNQRGAGRARRLLHRGVCSLLEEQYPRAEKLLQKGAQMTPMPLLHYLSAAEAAHNQQNYQQRDLYLEKAHTLVPQAKLAVLLTRVRLLEQQGNLTACGELLAKLVTHWPSHPAVLAHYYRNLQAQGLWHELIDVLPKLKKYKVLTGVAFDDIQLQAYRALMTACIERENVSALLAFWEAQPRLIRNNNELILTLIDVLLAHQAYTEAYQFLQPQLSSYSNNEALWQRCGQMQLNDTAAIQKILLKQLTTHPQSAPLLSAIGHLYFYQGQWVLAQNHLERSIALQKNVSDLRLMAQLMEKQRLFEKAAEYYRLSLTA